MTIIVGIVEDNEKISSLIQKYLNSQENFLCPITVDSVNDMLEYLEKHTHPNIILMDINLPGMSGIEGIRILKNKYPKIETMMLTIYNDHHKIFESLCAGASGYLLKHTSLPQIKESIEDLYNGGAPMSPQIARCVINHFSKSSQKKQPLDSLTTREHDIVRGLVDGLSYKMIANRLSISLETVRAHIRNTYKKLHVSNRSEVIVKSLRGEI